MHISLLHRSLGVVYLQLHLARDSCALNLTYLLFSCVWLHSQVYISVQDGSEVPHAIPAIQVARR